MKINFHSLVLITDKFDELKDFYCKTLKQEIEFDYGNCIGLKGGLSIWQLKEEYPIAQHLGRTFHKNGNKNIEVCFETDDFDEICEQLQNKKLTYLHDVHEEPWGQRTIRFYDPDKNLVEVGESVPSFVKRFAQQGMSAEEVSGKTSVAVDVVKQYLTE